MSGTWLESVPYGGFQGGTPESHAVARVGQGAMAAPGAPDETMTTVALIGGLVLITGGGAAVGWFIAKSKVGALIGGLLGLGYSAANLAVNASHIATDNARLQNEAARNLSQRDTGGAGAVANAHGAGR